MQKKIIVSVLFLMCVLGNYAFAVVVGGTFDEIFTVGSDGSTDAKSIFGWNEQPWLYLKLPSPPSAGWNVTGSWWKDPDGLPYFTGTDPTTEREVWHSLEDWLIVRKIGNWNVDAIYFYANNPNDPSGSGSTRFTVTPEPISSVLFLIGGAALVTRRYYRTRRIQKT